MSKYQEQSDEAVIAAVQQGETAGYAEVIRRYQQPLHRYATFLLGDPEEAADAVQQAFISAYTNIQGFDTNRTFSSWIYRIVHNHALKLVRGKHRFLNLDDFLFLPSAAELPEDRVTRKDVEQHAHDCLQQLPLHYREVLTLFFIAEKKYEEISDILHIPVGTVGTRITRAKKALRKLCQKNM